MQWFKHDSNANTDDKLQSVLLDYGLEGYGLYWYCLEMIVNRVDKDNINFELKHDARIIARNTGCSPQKISEMMKHFCDLGLFENNDGRITCLKIIKRLDTSMTSNKYMRELITKAKERHDAIMTLSDNDMTESDFIMQEEIRLEKKRKEENRVDNKTTYEIKLPECVDVNLWNDFMEVRKELKAKNTPRAINALITQINKIAEGGDDVNDAIAASIRSSWKDVYPLRSSNKNIGSGGYKTKFQQIQENNRKAGEEFLRDFDNHNEEKEVSHD